MDDPSRYKEFSSKELIQALKKAAPGFKWKGIYNVSRIAGFVKTTMTGIIDLERKEPGASPR